MCLFLMPSVLLLLLSSRLLLPASLCLPAWHAVSTACAKLRADNTSRAAPRLARARAAWCGLIAQEGVLTLLPSVRKPTKNFVSKGRNWKE